MFKIVIVDDDSIMRNYLKKLVDWEKEGFFIAGEAEDGKSALNVIKETMPDIVLTDIDMPVMNGVELIKKLYELKFKGNIIALSCYDDFEYVKLAMKYGASEYLLKHKVEEDDILEAVKSVIKSEAEIENQNFLSAEDYDRNINKSRIINNLINNIAYENLSQAEEDLIKYKVCVDINSFYLIKVQIDRLGNYSGMAVSNSMEMFENTVMGVIEEVVSGNMKGEVIAIGDAQFVIICSPEEKSGVQAQRRVFEMVLKIQEEIMKLTKRTVSFGISTEGNNILDLEKYYSMAVKALHYKLYKGKNSIVSFYEAVFSDEADNIKPIIQGIKGSLPEVSLCINEINKFFDELKSMKPSKDRFDVFMSSLLSIFRVYILEQNLEGLLVDIFEADIFKSLETLEEYRFCFIELSTRLGKLVQKETLPLRREMLTAIEYMRSNIDKNLSLKDIAAHVNLSRTYFSQRFKQLTGENVIDYLTKLRLEKAKALLMDPNVKVYEIALDIGFESQYYFNKLFKGATGLTPTEYRNAKLYRS